MRTKSQRSDRFYFFWELIIVCTVITVSFIIAYYPMLIASDHQYPMTTDGMGHFAKIKYMADGIKNFKFDSWFPYWYSGAATIQYYPPFSYVVLTTFYLITGNVMQTFKIFCFVSIFFGSLGVWAISHRFVGRWCGIFAASTHTVASYFLSLLTYEGVLAQGSIFMLTPWLLFTVITYIKTPTRRYFLANSILTFLLILSHAMHAFMICLSIALVLLFFIFTGKLKFTHYFFLGVSMAFGAALTAFWSVTGTTKLENHTIPYVLGEATVLWTAKPEWFYMSNNPKTNVYFDFVFLIVLLISFVLFLLSLVKKFPQPAILETRFFIPLIFLLSVFTLVLSFGQFVPGYKFLPMAGSLVPGRILSLTTLCANLLCGYLVYYTACLAKGRNLGIKFLCTLLVITILAGVYYPILTVKNRFTSIELDADYEEIFSTFNDNRNNFSKGRYTWVGSVMSAETYFPLFYNYNMADGYNIEGTTHNRSLWNYNIVLSSSAEDYIIKNMFMWNVRYCKVVPFYPDLIRKLQENNFKIVHNNAPVSFPGAVLMMNPSPSSYYLVDHRNLLTLGPGSPGIAMEFPYAIKAMEDNITSYNIEEFKKYKVLYIVEPEIKTLHEAALFEEKVRSILAEGIHVIIEPSNTQIIPLFGVSSFDMDTGNSPRLVKQTAAPAGGIESFEFQPGGSQRGLLGLDVSYYKLIRNNNRLADDVIGYKNIEEGKIYFIGMHLSQYLKSSTIRREGKLENQAFPYADSVKAIIESLINEQNVEKNYIPTNFAVTSSEWSNTTGKFSYTIPDAQEVTLSITYSPRWSATIDGRPLDIRARENLIVLDLPPGDHTVSLSYGHTIYGLVGYIISGVALFLLLLSWLFMEKLFLLTNKSWQGLRQYFEIRTI